MKLLFTGFKLNTIGQARVMNISKAFESLLTVIENYVPEGRELSLIRTKLEEASFYTKKGISLQKEYQDNAE